MALTLAARAQPAPAPPAEGAEAPEAPPRTRGVTTGISFDVTLFDLRGSNGSGTEYVLRASPTLTWIQRSGWLQGTLVYSGSLNDRRGVAYRQGSEFLSTLNASATAELVQGFGFIDASASAGQRSVLAVGSPVDSQQAGSNGTETRRLSLSPYVRSPLGGLAEFELRAAGTVTDGGSDASSNSNISQGSFFLRSPRSVRSVFGWGLSGAHQRVKFESSSAPTITDRASAELLFQPDVDWRFSVTGGKERTDVVGAITQSHDNYGAGVQWTPSSRTRVLLEAEQRYFGRAHKALVEHRFQRSVFRLSSTYDLNVANTLQSQAVTVYEYFMAVYAGQFPNLAERERFVLALIATLPGIDRDDLVGGALFSVAGIAAQKRRDVSWTWAGQRLTLNITGFESASSRIDTGGVNASSRNDTVALSGYAASAGWRLTPLTSISVGGSRTLTQDLALAAKSDLKSADIGLTTRLGPRTTAAMRARYSVFGGPTDSYRETNVNASLSLRF